MKKQKIDLSSDLIDEQLESQALANLVIKSKEFLDKTQKFLGGIGDKVFTGTRQLAYDLLLKRKEAGKPINAHLLDMDLKKEKVAVSVRGQFVDMVGSSDVVDWTHLEEYLVELKALAEKRELVYLVGGFKTAIVDGKDVTVAKKEFLDNLSEFETVEETKEVGKTMAESLLNPKKKEDYPIGGGLVSLGRWTIVGGEEGQGKTCFCLQLSYCATTGTTFLGRFPIKEPLSVLYLCGENVEDDMTIKTEFQLPELEKVRGKPIGKYLENLRVVYPDEVGCIQLDKKEGIATLEGWLQRYKPKILILDPLTNFVASSKSLSDDTIAREAGTALNMLARKYECFPFVVTHFKKADEKGQVAVWDKFHGSKYWMNLAVNHIAIYRANIQRYGEQKHIEFKFKTAISPPKLLVELGRGTLWYEEKPTDEMSKEKLSPKDVVKVLIRKCQGKQVPSILYEMVAEEYGCTKKQASELTKASLAQGLIMKGVGIKDKGLLLASVERELKSERKQKRGKGKREAEEESF